MLNFKVLRVAKRLRKEMTPAEKIMWEELRRKDLDGYKFRRQFPLIYDNCGFIADFYCAKIKLIIEIDSDIHEEKERKKYDEIRENILTKNGYKIIRFKNKDILYNLDKVLKNIKQELSAHPSPRQACPAP